MIHIEIYIYIQIRVPETDFQPFLLSLRRLHNRYRTFCIVLLINSSRYIDCVPRPTPWRELDGLRFRFDLYVYARGNVGVSFQYAYYRCCTLRPSALYSLGLLVFCPSNSSILLYICTGIVQTKYVLYYLQKHYLKYVYVGYVNNRDRWRLS